MGKKVVVKMTFLSSNNCENHRINVLFITPCTPPFGGLANQTTVLLDSNLFSSKYSVTKIRSNTVQSSEDPSNKRSTVHNSFFSLPVHAYKALISQHYSIIVVRANGDISFIRDMLIAVTASIWFRKPLVVHLHASRLGFWSFTSCESLKRNHRGFFPRLGELLGYRLAALLLKRSHSFSQLTESIDTFYMKLGFKKADFLIPNATIPQTVHFSNKDKNSILFVGRLSEEKGILDLLEALKEVKETSWTMNILGSSANSKDQEHIDRIMARHPFRNRVYFRGLVTGEHKWEFYRKSSIVVLPSYLEVFPNVLLEAMTTGNAIISSNVGEVESIVPSQGGSLISPGNIEELTQKLSFLLNNSELVRKMGMANLEYSSNYHAEHIAELFSGSISFALDKFNNTH
jgi:glycosyltransferase involved in cell wall biosynthesis